MTRLQSYLAGIIGSFRCAYGCLYADLVMLSNVALAVLLLKAWREHKIDKPSAVALMIVIEVVVTIPDPPQKTFSIVIRYML